ncbi:MAG: HIT domain-containing protein [Candidatus Paceibacterota bacterium]|jgi:bis(5'-adenosyl)-triphosphatase
MEKKIGCAFCELSEIKNRGLIIQNNLAWAFLTNIPIVPGHLLIVPNRCVAKVEDLMAPELAAIFELVLKLKPAMSGLFGATGFNFAWNDGVSGGQSVPHFHLHMIPR